MLRQILQSKRPIQWFYLAAALLAFLFAAAIFAAERMGVITASPPHYDKYLMSAAALMVSLLLYSGRLPAWLRRVNRKDLLALLPLLLIALGMNIFLMVRNPNIGGDALQYHSVVHNFFAGRGYATDIGNIGFVEPGYGILSYLVYLLTGSIEYSGMIVTALAYLLLIPAVYFTIRFLFDRPTAFYAAFVTAIWPILVSYSYISYTDVVFTFFLLLCFSSYTRILLGRPSLGRYLLLGLLLGGAYLIRPEGFLIGLTVLASLFILPFARRATKEHPLPEIKTSLLRALAALAVFTLLAAPWILYIHSQRGVWAYTPKMVRAVPAESQTPAVDDSGDEDALGAPAPTPTPEPAYQLKRYIVLPRILNNLSGWTLLVFKMTANSFAPLALVLILCLLIPRVRRTLRFRLSARNLLTAWAFLLFAAPGLIYLTTKMADRYLMPYVLYGLLFTACLTVRFARKLFTTWHEPLVHAALLACLLAFLPLFPGSYLTHNLPFEPLSLSKTITTRHGHLGLRAAGQWLRSNASDPSQLRVLATKKTEVLLFYSSGEQFPLQGTGESIGERSLEETAALITSGQYDYLVLEPTYLLRAKGILPLWDDPSLAPRYGLRLLYQQPGLVQIYGR